MSEENTPQDAADMARAAAEGRGKLLAGMFPAGETEIAKTDRSFCAHYRFGYYVDKATRSVTCKGCKVALDAFDVLLEYANGERNWKHWLGESSKEQKKLHDAHEELLRVKARTRSHNRKDAETAVADERKRMHERLGHLSFKANEIVRMAMQIERELGPIMPQGSPPQLEPRQDPIVYGGSGS